VSHVAPLLEELPEPRRAGSRLPDASTEVGDTEHDIGRREPALRTLAEEALCDADDALQTMTRRQDSDVEIVEGILRVEFASGQRETTIHVAFCPPLPSRPDVELEDLDATEWDLKIAACYPFGIRIAIRRRPDAAADGRIAYFASSALRRAA
ncbi:MAG: hypothetical protein B7Z55_10085, partial [Planctomycetales bacterium 12-60-4]